jgi:hypothetical protein
MVKKNFLLLIMALIVLSACAQGNPLVATPTLSNGNSLVATPIALGGNPTPTATKGNPTPTPSSGIEGYVTKGPVCPGPIRIGDTKCQDQPYQTYITILDANNSQITQFQTDSMGYFKFPLKPGTYTLHPETDKRYPTATDQSAVVIDGQFTQVMIRFDTGIR